MNKLARCAVNYSNSWSKKSVLQFWKVKFWYFVCMQHIFHKKRLKCTEHAAMDGVNLAFSILCKDTLTAAPDNLCKQQTGFHPYLPTAIPPPYNCCHINVKAKKRHKVKHAQWALWSIHHHFLIKVYEQVLCSWGDPSQPRFSITILRTSIY